MGNCCNKRLPVKTTFLEKTKCNTLVQQCINTGPAFQTLLNFKSKIVHKRNTKAAEIDAAFLGKLEFCESYESGESSESSGNLEYSLDSQVPETVDSNNIDGLIEVSQTLNNLTFQRKAVVTLHSLYLLDSEDQSLVCKVPLSKIVLFFISEDLETALIVVRSETDLCVTTKNLRNLVLALEQNYYESHRVFIPWVKKGSRSYLLCQINKTNPSKAKAEFWTHRNLKVTEVLLRHGNFGDKELDLVPFKKFPELPDFDSYFLLSESAICILDSEYTPKKTIHLEDITKVGINTLDESLSVSTKNRTDSWNLPHYLIEKIYRAAKLQDNTSIVVSWLNTQLSSKEIIT